MLNIPVLNIPVLDISVLNIPELLIPRSPVLQGTGRSSGPEELSPLSPTCVSLTGAVFRLSLQEEPVTPPAIPSLQEG